MKKKKTLLYLGLNIPSYPEEIQVIHYPIIKVVPRLPLSAEIRKAFELIPYYTHLIFTSQSTVRFFFKFFSLFQHNKSDLSNKIILAIGRKTANLLQENGVEIDNIPEEETAEGILTLLSEYVLQKSWIFWPHSALSRPVLKDYFATHHIRYTECILYDTVPHRPGPLPNLGSIDEIVFTSPSTVDAFIEFFGRLPEDIKLTPIGPVTARKLLTETKLIGKHV